MENVLHLFPHFSITASSGESHFKVFKEFQKHRAKKDSGNGLTDRRNRRSRLQKAESHENVFLDKSETFTCITSVSPEEAEKWGESFDKLLSHKDGIEAFKKFLKMEFSDENLEFWLECEEYKQIKTNKLMNDKAKSLHEKYIQMDSPREVNLDFTTKEITKKSIEHPAQTSFDLAQTKIYTLMEKDSYPRFLKSNIYSDMLSGKQMLAKLPAGRRRSRSFTVNDFQQFDSDSSIWL
ncbi:regulator of G-protein signaling 18 L homeolog [Xenopus laevis]|uniref:MGC80762 protein n=2 Tax=Xenopus laevis TaxID=8355 RepID=Q6GP01_XENLA|nr:regulator of G-protein signaling 18 L homeolog [Xenopus laevis]AAH73348.1 MGC80762 protein [Xenopus laevis]OCT85407.1 hypothetical protein XELAEV_18023574mg [Xenopus laevis]